MKRALLGAARYIPGIALLALLVWGTSPLRRLLGINVDSTPLIILTMVGTAWYLGRGPGLLVAFAFEGTLDYFSPAPFTWGRFTLIAFNRLLLFTSIVVFTSARRRAEFTLQEQQKALEEALARERVARADAEKANRLQDEFLATISHELRTPLNALLGWSSILERKDDLDVAVTRKALDAIARSARAQARIVEDVLDMSRITAGVLSVKQQPVDVSIVVNEAVDSMRLPSTEKGLVLTAAVAPDLCVIGDAGRLRQIVWNLVSNALKFTPPGGAIMVSLERVNEDLELKVQDTGIGIAREFLPLVFDRFRQADGSMTREQGGLGLGLAIVRELTERHGGSVAAESMGLGQGATFTVRLPVAPTGVLSQPLVTDRRSRLRVVEN